MPICFKDVITCYEDVIICFHDVIQTLKDGPPESQEVITFWHQFLIS
ncbi:hypothetical protein [Sphingobacterium faecium]|nr:hypothetical protein [Sphingobacterium faecium]PTX12544.1 hypothetical protein C8N37_102238 [Sphingobacterium faecium]